MYFEDKKLDINCRYNSIVTALIFIIAMIGVSYIAMYICGKDFET